jgi:hypothetical protein
MEHTEAIQTNATERYLLGELSAAEVDAFEDHYFDCMACADDVRSAAQLLDGGRQLVREPAAPKEAPVVSIAAHRARRFGWLPLVAAAMLVIAVGLPMVRRSGGDGASFEVGREHSLLLSGTRGGDAGVITLSDDQPAVLYVDVPPEPTYARYDTRLAGPDGKVIAAREVTPEQTKDPLPLVLRGLAAGQYELVIEGADPAGQHAEIARYRFTIRR